MVKRRRFLALLSSLPFLSRFSFADDPLEGESSEPLSEQTGVPSDEGKRYAFEVGEKLTYSLGWQFIVAGYVTSEVLEIEEYGGEKLWSFEMEARTHKAVDPIYKVRDNLSALTDEGLTRSMGYTKIQREGKTKRDVTVDFDWENLKAHYFEGLSGDSRSIPIQENTFDPLSAFYSVRNRHLEVGTILEGPVTDGKRCKMAKVEVVKRETIKVNGRKYDTFKIKPDLQDVGGVFEKSKDANMEIWITTDYRHIPVLLKSKVAIGSFKAELETKI